MNVFPYFVLEFWIDLTDLNYFKYSLYYNIK